MKAEKIQGFWEFKGRLGQRMRVATRRRQAAVVAVFCVVGSVGTSLWGQGTLEVRTPDVAKERHAAEVASALEGREKVGVVLPANVDVLSLATHEMTEQGQAWRLEIHAPGAEAVCLYFDDFFLPAGAELFFETPEGAYADVWSEGPVTSFENNAHRRWTNNEVPGDRLVLRLTVPAGTVEQPALHVEGVGFFVRGMHFQPPFEAPQSRGGAGECEVDIMCPEGDSWQCDKDAVVKLRITQSGGIYFCSGAMVNNVEEDCRQLMLSAFHCADAVAEDEWPYFKVQFNYEFSECGGTSSINSRTRTGVIHLTDSDDMTGGQINGSDFLLVEVEDPIDSAWHPYLAGWDATGFNGHSGVGIHHPSGDRKKVSTYTSQMTTSGVYAPGAHWRVTWAATSTNHGVTETGSSGSPVFDENHHIVGTLSGGSSFCTTPYAPDYYGKMSYHWEGNNPIPESQRLAAFLDPNGTGQKVQHGSYITTDLDGAPSCSEWGSCEATSVEHAFLVGLVLAPNPMSDVLTVAVPAGHRVVELRMFDNLARLVATQRPLQGEGKWEWHVPGLSSGVHFVTFTTADGLMATRKVVVE